MAILSVHEVTGREGSEDENFKRDSTRVWQVLCDAIHTEAEILAGSGLPVLFDLHPVFTKAMVVKRRARQSTNEDEPFVWEVTLEYSTQSRSKLSPSDRNQNPTDRPAILKINFEHQERALYVDLEGDAIVNSAGQPLDPPPSTEVTIGIITISRNIATVDFGQYMDFNGATNVAPFMGFKKDELKIALEAERVYEQQQYFFSVTATIKVYLIVPINVGGGALVDFGGWQLKALDAGYATLEDDNEIKQITDEVGNPRPKPALLDGGGQELAHGAITRFIPSGLVVHSKPWYVVTKRRNFSDLNLI